MSYVLLWRELPWDRARRHKSNELSYLLKERRAESGDTVGKKP